MDSGARDQIVDERSVRRRHRELGREQKFLRHPSLAEKLDQRVENVARRAFGNTASGRKRPDSLVAVHMDLLRVPETSRWRNEASYGARLTGVKDSCHGGGQVIGKRSKMRYLPRAAARNS